MPLGIDALYTSNVMVLLHLYAIKSQARGYKMFSWSTQLTMNFVLRINLKLLTIVNYVLLNIAEHENFSADKYENDNYCWHFHIY